MGGTGLQSGAPVFSSHADAWVGGGSPQAGASMAHPYAMGQVAPVNTASGVGYYDDDGTIVARSELVKRSEWEDDGELGVHPIEKCISRAVRSSWVRVDYLNSSISDLEGETPNFDLTAIGQHGVNGIQTTLGLPTTFGSFELSGFLLEQSSDEPFATGFSGSPTSYRSRFASNVWGTDMNFISDPVEPGEGFKLRPMGGVRYFAIREAMRIPHVLPPTPLIRSETFNHVLAPQIGLRSELVHRWFTIGAEPKVGFGVNTFFGEIIDNNFLGQGIVYEKEYETSFAPFFDLDVYARVPFNEHFSFYVAYNLLLMAGVSRPMDNLAHDTEFNFHLDTATRGYRLDGYTVGLELTF